MRREYQRWFSRTLGRDMEMLVFGHAGRPVVVFPTSVGAFFEYEDRGMVGALADKLEAGALQLFCVSTVDKETFYAKMVSPRDHIDRYLQYERYLVDEVVPFIGQQSGSQTAGVTGCSFGVPLFWLGIVYLGSLLALLVQSFFHLDDFTGLVVRQLSLSTYADLLTRSNLDIIARTAGMAAAVTLAAALLAFPIAYFIAMYASPRLKPFLYLLVIIPLWSSYLVRIYSCKLILAKEGILSWIFSQLNLDWLLEGLLRLPYIGGPSLSISRLGIFIVFTYVWLPYMIVPVVAALERVHASLLDASGARR